jgi:hypothetical protein
MGLAYKVKGDAAVRNSRLKRSNGGDSDHGKSTVAVASVHDHGDDDGIIYTERPCSSLCRGWVCGAKRKWSSRRA